MSAAATPGNRVGLGIFLRLAAVVMMGCMAALVKLCGERGVGPFEIVFFRNVVAFIPLGLFIFPSGGLRVLRTQRPLGHLLRSSLGVSGMILGAAALSRIPITEFTAIQFAAPLLITALSGPVLGEHVGPHRWAAVVIGFCGVLVILRPDPAHIVAIGALLALGQMAGTSASMLTIRQLGATESGPTIVFYFTLLAVVVGAIGMPFGWVTPDPATLGLLVLTGLTGGTGQILLTQAFRVAPAAAVAPFDYATMLWNGFLGFMIWNELPRGTTVIGGLIVVGCGLYLVWRETRRARTAS